MTPVERSRQMVEDLKLIESLEDRYQYLIDLGKRLPPLPEAMKREEFRIEGCQSQLWVVPEHREGCCYFQADSDATITKGIASLLTQVCSGGTPEEILALDETFLAEAGITQHLTPNRRNGLSGVWKRLRSFAESCR